MDYAHVRSNEVLWYWFFFFIFFCQIRSDISAKTASLNTVQNKHHGFITLLNIINLALYNLNTCTRTFVSLQEICLKLNWQFPIAMAAYHYGETNYTLYMRLIRSVWSVNSEVWFICLPAESKVYDVSCLSAEGWVSFAGDISETLSRGVKSIWKPYLSTDTLIHSF